MLLSGVPATEHEIFTLSSANTRKRFDILETLLTRVGENSYSVIEYVSFNIYKR